MMHSLLATLVLLSVPTVLVGQAGSHDPTEALPIARIDSVFTDLDRTDGPGCTVGVFEHGELSYAQGYGVANLEYGIALRPSSVFHIASISKQFTAFAVELLVSEGKVSWDDPIQRYVPQIPEYEWPVTLRHLVTHTSGVRDQWSLLNLAGWRWEADLVTEANAIELISRQTALNFRPGEQYLYSNSGFTLLTAVVEQVTGQSLKEFTQETIFGPLGMTNTHFHDDHQTIVPSRAVGYKYSGTEGWKISIPDFDIVGATSLFTTVEDMAKWDQNLRDEVLGSPDLFARFLERGILNNGDTITYAHGISTGSYRGQPTIGHGGADAGYRSNYQRFPDSDLGIVSFCNFSGGTPGRYVREVADILLEDRLDEMGDDAAADPPQINTERWAEQFSGMSGYYRESRTDIPIRIWTHQGMARIGTGFKGGASGDLLLPQGDGRFTLWPSGDSITVSMEGGVPVSLSSGTLTYEFVGSAQADLDAAPFLGTYWSEELGTEYRIEGASGNIGFVLTHRIQNPIRFRLAYEDGARAGGRWITFERNDQGEVTGFTHSDARAWKVRFTRR